MPSANAAAGAVPAALLVAPSKELSKHPLYRQWLWMMLRCYVPADLNYARYGARGVAVDAVWHDPRTFFADVAARPSRAHSLDRIDVSGPYSKENTRWATPAEQANNKENTRWVTVEGVRMPFQLACKKYAVKYGTARTRLLAGWSHDQVFGLVDAPLTRLTYNGETRTLSEWAELRKINPSTLRRRHEMDYPVEQTLGFAPVEWDRRKLTGRAREMNKPRTAFGREQKLSDWAREFGIKLTTLCYRLSKMSLEEALTVPVRERTSG